MSVEPGACVGGTIGQELWMPSAARVTIHPSQFPNQVRQDLLVSLRTRQVNHKFHYDSVKQTQRWLELHEAYSPARTDANCQDTYDASFRAVADMLDTSSAHVVGLGCGGGQKDARLLKLLQQSGKNVVYTPVDVSVAMVLVAREAALSVVMERDCCPVVCDLVSIDDFSTLLDQRDDPDASRLVSFFGMIPNFEPQYILPRLSSLVRAGDHLLFSANLAPGEDYLAGIRSVLPLYDNELTREWLLVFLLDLGVEREDGKLLFSIEEKPIHSGLNRITANFHFVRSRQIQVDGELFLFQAGESIRLFFSYRYQPKQIRSLLKENNLNVLEQWITKSGEEGVFLCTRDS